MGCRSPLAIGGGREQGTGLFVPNIINHGHCSQREITNLLPCGVSVLVALPFAGEVMLLLLGVTEMKLPRSWEQSN